MRYPVSMIAIVAGVVLTLTWAPWIPPNRRGPRLQPCAQRGWDPDRHEHADSV